MILNEFCLDTPLGSMTAIANDEALLLLEFTDQEQKRPNAPIITGRNEIIQSIEEELNAYFAGQLNTFTTPISPIGSPFQHRVWQVLREIPFGQTLSYRQQAERMGQAKAYRAVANANGANPLAIIIPCHRVINSNGQLGGYAGGIERKQWLIHHEMLAIGA